MKIVKITKVASPICWWRQCVGQFCPVLEEHEDTQFYKIRVMDSERFFEHEPFERIGGIPMDCVEVIGEIC